MTNAHREASTRARSRPWSSDHAHGHAPPAAMRPMPSSARVLARAIGGAFASLLARYRRHLDHEKAIAELAAMGDRELEDLGITRADIVTAVRRGRDAVGQDRDPEVEFLPLGHGHRRTVPGARHNGTAPPRRARAVA